jgi:regulation of enolase protein 1 (concanavalin A-like superfamily)
MYFKGENYMNLFQDIKGKNITHNLSWLNEPSEWSFSDRGLEINAPAASDFFNDAEVPSNTNSAPYLFTKLKGDFDITTRIDIKMLEMFDSGCIMVMADLNNWAKLCYENWLSEPSIVSVVTRTTSDDCPSLRIGETKPYLKILRSGNCFGFHYSLNNINWTLIRYFSMDVPEELKVGVVAQAPTGNGCKVSFEFLKIDIKDIKSAKFVNR